MEHPESIKRYIVVTATMEHQKSQDNIRDYQKIVKKELNKDKQPQAASDKPTTTRSILKVNREIFVKDEDNKKSENKTRTNRMLQVPSDAQVKKRIKLDHQPSCQSDRSVAQGSQIQPAAPSNLATSDNTVELFLAAITPTLKSFPLYLSNITKTKIFSIVQEAEIEFLKQPQQIKKMQLPQEFEKEHRSENESTDLITL